MFGGIYTVRERGTLLSEHFYHNDYCPHKSEGDGQGIVHHCMGGESLAAPSYGCMPIESKSGVPQQEIRLTAFWASMSLSLMVPYCGLASR
jgi:hypothetical protein